MLETDDGRFLPESNAILVYLADGTPFLPDDAFERAEIVRWLIYEQTNVIPTMGGLRFRLLVGRLTPDDPDAVRRKEGSLEVLRFLDDHLAEREFYVGGRYTIADIAIYGYTHLAHEAGIEMEPYVNLRAWFERVEQHPGYVEDVGAVRRERRTGRRPLAVRLTRRPRLHDLHRVAVGEPCSRPTRGPSNLADGPQTRAPAQVSPSSWWIASATSATVAPAPSASGSASPVCAGRCGSAR